MKALTQRNLKIAVILVIFSFASFWFLKTGKHAVARTVVSTNYDLVDIGESERYIGPFISRPAVLEKLEELSDGDCNKSGQLAFPCLIQEIQDKANRTLPTKNFSNPFNLPVMDEITEMISKDLEVFRKENIKTPEKFPVPPLYSNFLKDKNSRLQLVGIVNRMDRKTNIGIKSKTTEGDPYRCGEISLIYRFLYSLDNTGSSSSRVPVTMNVVFPALTSDLAKKTGSCQVVASRWMAEMNQFADRDKDKVEKDLTDKKNGILSTLKGSEIDRIELNLQAFRVSAGSDKTGLGSPAIYIIRVFRWKNQGCLDKQTQRRYGCFAESFLHNQIDRARLLKERFEDEDGNLKHGDYNTCKNNRDTPLDIENFKKDVLGNPLRLAQIDSGSVIIPTEYLACRAISGSPGGAYRSINNQFWNANAATSLTEKEKKKQQLLTDKDIMDALEKVSKNPKIEKFQYIKNAEDFRLRLSEQSCSGCHQARAIAGFHFPGADRINTISTNAVYLPGSPHFYGDQPRRMQILREYANATNSGDYERAPSYASRPDDRFKKSFEESFGRTNQFIGGWGATCLIDDYSNQKGDYKDNLETARSKWTCNDGLACVQIFKSNNAPGMGTCVSDRSKRNLQIGDALQIGEITSKQFGDDEYTRTSNKISKDNNDKNRLIDLTKLSPLLGKLPSIPEGNSYLGAHQEFYSGKSQPNDEKSYYDKDKSKDYFFDCKKYSLGSEERSKCLEHKRDYSTGGFSGGMLRLTECKNLPPEATCALVAFSGFNTCIEDVNAGKKGKDGNKMTIDQCFKERTAYAGLRACDLNSPCRDDYICLRPLVKTSDDNEYISDILSGFEKRKTLVDYLKDDFGQKPPDEEWLNRKDRSGVCIPPYFVFQFRSDGHPSPNR